jgi:hypothetical protein
MPSAASSTSFTNRQTRIAGNKYYEKQAKHYADYMKIEELVFTSANIVQFW